MFLVCHNGFVLLAIDGASIDGPQKDEECSPGGLFPVRNVGGQYVLSGWVLSTTTVVDNDFRFLGAFSPKRLKSYYVGRAESSALVQPTSAARAFM